MGNILTTKPRLVVSLLCNLDLQNAKELHYSFFRLSNTCTMAILGNVQTRVLDAERVRQSYLKGFTSNSLVVAMQTFAFMVSLNMDC